MKPLTYDQLSESAKETVRQEWRGNDNGLDYDWWDYTIDDWKEQLSEKGYPDADICFSGFSSQGDGASFSCGAVTRSFELPAELALEVVETATVEWCRLAMEDELPWEGMTKEDLASDWTPMISASISKSGRYCHEMTMSVNCEARMNDDSCCPEDLAKRLYAWADDLEGEILEEARDLARDIYQSLENEYDHLTSDESVDESIMCNWEHKRWNEDGEEWDASMLDEDDLADDTLPFAYRDPVPGHPELQLQAA